MNRAAAFVLVSALLLGCDALASKDDAVLCDVATALATARGLTEEALVKDEGGDTDGAQQLAAEARSVSQQAHDRLQTIRSDEVRHGATWQALLVGYGHVGQAANGLLPGYESTPQSTRDELAGATQELKTAGEGLPARCFVVSASPSG